MGVEIITALVDSIVENMSTLVGAATKLIVAFLFEITNHVEEVIAAGTALLANLLLGIANNILTIATTVTTIITEFIKAVGDNAGDVFTAGADTLIEFLDGLADDTLRMLAAGKDITLKILEGTVDNTIDFVDKAGKILIKFLDGLASAIRTHSPELRRAGLNLADAILDGVTFGMSDKIGGVITGAKNVGKGVIGGIAGALGISSPSKEMIKIGRFTVAGLVKAFREDTTAEGNAKKLGDRVVDRFQQTLMQIPDSLADMDNFNPVITPVLDLSKVQRDSNDFNRFMKISSIKAEMSFDRARVISSSTGQDATDAAQVAPTGPTELKFEQHNYSPKALSTNDIYRNTKSQIKLAKEELNI